MAGASLQHPRGHPRHPNQLPRLSLRLHPRLCLWLLPFSHPRPQQQRRRSRAPARVGGCHARARGTSECFCQHATTSISALYDGSDGGATGRTTVPQVARRAGTINIA